MGGKRIYGFREGDRSEYLAGKVEELHYTFIISFHYQGVVQTNYLILSYYVRDVTQNHMEVGNFQMNITILKLPSQRESQIFNTLLITMPKSHFFTKNGKILVT